MLHKNILPLSSGSKSYGRGGGQITGRVTCVVHLENGTKRHPPMF